MAGPLSGAWARQNVGYSGASVWGTGINPVHAYYGSPPARVGNLAMREGEITSPGHSYPEQLIPTELWGYQLEDSLYTGVQYDDRPNWTQEPSQFRSHTGSQPSWAAGGATTNRFRALRGGAMRLFRSVSPMPGHIQYQEPSETVSEGWLNKPHGQPANSVPSDDKQLIVQTAMVQRYQTRANDQAVARGTDEPRTGIASLVTGQKLKVYSGGERHYDMEPKVQDTIPRAFWYRTAGTGMPGDMLPNTMYTVQPLQRIPPAEPSMGIPETSQSAGYGYTSEDMFYA
jgi:hypothetical protein